MKIYTRGGDQGMTSLLNGERISKADDRIELLGSIDELNSHIGLAKAAADQRLCRQLSELQRTLMTIMSGIAAPGSAAFFLECEDVDRLEGYIDELENAFSRKKDFVLYGSSELSARLDLARAVARRAERQFWRLARGNYCDRTALRFMNRLSDYLYMCARYAEQ